MGRAPRVRASIPVIKNLLPSSIATWIFGPGAATAAATEAATNGAAVPEGHGLVSLRRLSRLRWALLAGQALLLFSCESVAGIILPFQPLLLLFVLQTAFNLLTTLRLRGLAARRSAPADGELMAQMMVDLTALSAILFFTGGATNPFVSFYLPGLAIAAAILPWRLVAALALYALACYSLLLLEYVPLNLHNPDNAVNYHLAGMWLNFVASAVMIAFFVARLSGVLRQRDAELNLAREQLLREARVEALNNQAAAVAHEIGTPLATLAVIAGELRADADDGAGEGGRGGGRGETAIAAYLQDLRTMEQQLDLCRSILARLREDHATLAPQPIGTWLAAFAERWQLRHPQAALRAVASAEAARHAVDVARVGQILTILLDNAARSQQAVGLAMHAEPALRLDITLVNDHRGAQDASLPVLSCCVTDRGTGIPAAVRARLGEAPVASTHGGQGIGLYLAQSAARQLGGRLAWHDNPGGGTVAELRLPLASAMSAPSTPSPAFQP
ncbi:ATP-binding protein [Cupriavidus plantarum]|nr:signal transduction histidine kinase [Cupriavidus plantarum]RLK35959.1 signal transduction histidine kinase [Cupriavidus plantarum]CAG2126722.1 Sensor histidine kinase RegB [Cupriavidus plantarum]SMR67779.1 signal transduction histidine kinase [Cupriavidus plantarum]